MRIAGAVVQVWWSWHFCADDAGWIDGRRVFCLELFALFPLVWSQVCLQILLFHQKWTPFDALANQVCLFDLSTDFDDHTGLQTELLVDLQLAESGWLEDLGLRLLGRVVSNLLGAQCIIVDLKLGHVLWLEQIKIVRILLDSAPQHLRLAIQVLTA